MQCEVTELACTCLKKQGFLLTFPGEFYRTAEEVSFSDIFLKYGHTFIF